MHQDFGNMFIDNFMVLFWMDKPNAYVYKKKNSKKATFDHCFYLMQEIVADQLPTLNEEGLSNCFHQ